MTVCPKEMRTGYQKYICTLIFIVLLFPVAKEVEAMQLPIHVWACTHTHTHTHTQRERLLTHEIRKQKNLPFVKRWMDFEGITLGEINQRKTNTV